MKKIVLAGLLGAIGSPALAADSPWYVALSAGALFRTDGQHDETIFNATGLTGPGTNSFRFNTGPAIDLALGYRVSRVLRIEADVGVTHDRLISETPRSTDGAFPAFVGNRLYTYGGGSRDSIGATVNGYLDLPVSRGITPYLGGGGGVYIVHADETFLAGPGGSPRFRTAGSASDPTYGQAFGEAGVAFRLSRAWSVVPSYRFVHVFTTGNAIRNEAHVARAGIRYAF